MTSLDFPGYPEPFRGLLPRAAKGDEAACFALLPLGVEHRLFPTASRCVPQDLPRAIPRRIAQFWDSPDPPEDIREAMAGIKRDNPGFSYHLACDESAHAFIREHFGQDVAALYESCFHPAMRSDFWRLCHLHVKGGVYVDADAISRMPLKSLTQGLHFRTLLSYSTGNPWCLDNDVLIQEPGNPLMTHIMDTMFHRVRVTMETGYFQNVWHATGPGAMVIGTMSWIARMLAEQAIPFNEINSCLSEAGVVWIPHPHVEHVLDTCAPFAYQETDANWRHFRR